MGITKASLTSNECSDGRHTSIIIYFLARIKKSNKILAGITS